MFLWTWSDDTFTIFDWSIKQRLILSACTLAGEAVSVI
jgi:hypothetical protein